MKIKEVILFTRNIQNQKKFYKTILGFELLEDAPDIISIKLGESILTFQFKEDAKPTHFAFNIPSNAIYDALIWLRKRTEVLDYEGEKIAEFINWKAKAIYFYDADKNIVELIARERINTESDIAFTANSVLSISEMGLVTEDIEGIFNDINRIKHIQVFDGDFKRFCALGDDFGLFIVIDKTKKKWNPMYDEAYTSEFIIKGDYNFSYLNGKIKELN